MLAREVERPDEVLKNAKGKKRKRMELVRWDRGSMRNEVWIGPWSPVEQMGGRREVSKVRRIGLAMVRIAGTMKKRAPQGGRRVFAGLH